MKDGQHISSFSGRNLMSWRWIWSNSITLCSHYLWQSLWYSYKYGCGEHEALIMMTTVHVTLHRWCQTKGKEQWWTWKELVPTNYKKRLMFSSLWCLHPQQPPRPPKQNKKPDLELNFLICWTSKIDIHICIHNLGKFRHSHYFVI